MAEFSLVWGGTTVGDAGPYTFEEWQHLYRIMFQTDNADEGVIRAYLNELEVTGVATPVSVNTGAALVDGAPYENTVSVSVAIPVPGVATRIDRIVLRKTWATQLVRITRIAGVEGGAEPALVQVDGTTWDVPLATVYATTGGDVIVLDKRIQAETPLGKTLDTFRSLVINGAMQISQRGTSEAGVTTAQFADAPDRWYFSINAMGTWTLSQATDGPRVLGTSYKMDCTVADAAPAASDRVRLEQRVEGQFLQLLQKGTPTPENISLSFYVKSTRTGTYVVELLDADNNRHICSLYTIDVANTWERKIVTFPGDTAGAFDNDNALSLYLNFWFGAGSDFTTGTLATVWAARVDVNRAVGCGNMADNTANEVLITGIQLERGSFVTGYEHIPLDQVLERCLRYYQKSLDGEIWFGDVTNLETYYKTIFLPKQMRASPTVTPTAVADNRFDGVPVVHATYTDEKKFTINEDCDSTGAGGFFRFTWVADAEL